MLQKAGPSNILKEVMWQDHNCAADAQTKSVLLPKDTDREMSRMLCSLLHQQSAPDVDIWIFAGDPLEYHFFMSSFRGAVEQIDRVRLIFWKHCHENLSFHNLKLGEYGWKHIFQQVFRAHRIMYFPKLLKTSLLSKTIHSQVQPAFKIIFARIKQ